MLLLMVGSKIKQQRYTTYCALFQLEHSREWCRDMKKPKKLAPIFAPPLFVQLAQQAVVQAESFRAT